VNKCFVLLALLALLAGPALAQGYAYIPDNIPSSGGGNNWPLNFSSTTGRFIQLLDSQYLPNAPVKFVDVAFSRYSTTYPSSFSAKQFQMRMSHTTRTVVTSTFANNFAPCPTNVINTTSGFTYAPPNINAWGDFGTTCDFGYDGKRSICLEIRYRGQVTSLGFPCRSASIARVWANGSGDNWVAVTGSTGSSGGLKTRLTYVKDNILLAPDTASIGTSVAVQGVNMAIGDFYQIGASLGQTPLSFGNCHICLDVDAILFASLLVGPPIFNGYAGTVPVGGSVNAKFAVPNLTALIGLCVYHAGVSYDNKGVTGCTNTAGTQLTK
jgi:hypothetical protein